MLSLEQDKQSIHILFLTWVLDDRYEHLLFYHLQYTFYIPYSLKIPIFLRYKKLLDLVVM